MIARLIRRPEAAPLAFLLVVGAALATTTPGFLTGANLLAILTQTSVVGVVALALNTVILAGEIDVSVGSLLAACALTYASVAQTYGPGPGPFLAALAVGLAAGAVNGLVVSAGRVPSIIATLGMLMALRGGVLLIGANGVVVVPEGARSAGLGALFGVPAPVLILALTFAAFALLGAATTWGRDVLAVGGNARAAAAVGLKAGRVKALTFVATGVACAVASAVFAGQTGQIQATAAQGFELQCIAAVVLGGTRITGGRGSTLAPVLGAVVVGTILNALTLNRVPATFEQLVLGVLILFALSLDALRSRFAGAHA